MISKPKTIKVFHIDGEPTGTKLITLGNWDGICYEIPRYRLEDTLKSENDSLEGQGVYFLLGENDEHFPSTPLLYVGEAENFVERLKQQNKTKDFWNKAIVFQSKSESLTKAHIKYLELESINRIRRAHRITLENRNKPTITKLPRPDKAEAEEFLANSQFILSSLGYTFFEELETSGSDTNLFFCSGPNSKGRGVYDDEGFFLLKGSIIRAEETKSISSGLSLSRFQAIRSSSLEKYDDKSYKVVKAIRFSSPSYAAGFVLGRNANGWVTWKTEAGITLDALKRSK